MKKETVNEFFESDSIEERKNSIKEKTKKVCDTVKETTIAIAEWSIDNKELIAVAVPVVIFGIKTLDKNLSIAREAKLKDCSIYDHSMGMYLVSKKPLTTAQKLDIDAMHKAGKSYREIGKELNIKWK